MKWTDAAATAKLYLGLGSDEEYLRRGTERDDRPLTLTEIRRTKKLNLVATLFNVAGGAALIVFVDSLVLKVGCVVVLVAERRPDRQLRRLDSGETRLCHHHLALLAV